MAEIVFSILGKIAEYSVAPIGRQFGYLFCYNVNIKKMGSQVEKLEDKRIVVQEEVNAAHNNCEAIRPDVTAWLASVNKNKTEANAIMEEKEKVGKGCWNEWCLNLKSHYLLSRKATKKTQDLVALLADGKFPRVSLPLLPSGVVHTSVLDPRKSSTSTGSYAGSTSDKKKTEFIVEVQQDGKSKTTSYNAPVPALGITSTSTGSSGGFESRSVIMRDVMEVVKNDKIRMIGIWGMGGIGKTTLVNEVKKKVKEEPIFNEVVMVVVTQKQDVKMIQENIAELLGLKFEEQDLSARAVRLYKRLTQKDTNNKPKKILIILDDLWKRLDLEEVGIPSGDDVNSFKILLTSRRKDVCDQMNVNQTFHIEVLVNEEAWVLFQKSLGNFLYANDQLYQVAQDIVKECGGLPIAITTIARALAKKKEHTWNDVLQQLKKYALIGEYAKVYETLQLSYDFIESEEIKGCFLLCCLFPEDSNIDIEDLVRYGTGLRLYKNVDKLHEAREKAHAYVEMLRNSNLLIRSDSEDSVKMHDLVRDFALSITSKGQRQFMVRFDKSLTEWPLEDTYEQYTKISLQCDEMVKFPNELKCPNLELLQLDVSNNRFLEYPLAHLRLEVSNNLFPDRFFDGMEKLQVLALKKWKIPSLPMSLQHLTNLRTLFLNGCVLYGNVSIIGSIRNLEILSFGRTDIQELPREIGSLSRLRLLDLTGCYRLEGMAPGILSRLTRLEELYMTDTSIHWAEQISYETYASFSELKQLPNLVVVEVDIPYEVLPIDLKFWENLKQFKISIGGAKGSGDAMASKIVEDPWESRLHKRFQNTLLLVVAKDVLLKGVINVLSRKTDVLHLKSNDLKGLVNDPEEKDFTRLKTLKLENCSELVTLINKPSQGTTNFFPNLESMYLYALENLEEICRCRHSNQSIHSLSMNQLTSFGNLRDLELTGCKKLKSLFSLSIASGLIKLKTLKIEDCSRMEEIFTKERRNEDEKGMGKIGFPNLKSLLLRNLPNLVAFCNDVDEIELPELEEMTLRLIPKLKTWASQRHHVYAKPSFFNQKVTFNKIATLTVEGLENLMEVWPAECEDVSTSEPRYLTVANCDKLLNVFPYNIIIQRLQNLEHLKVYACSSVEVIFDLQGLISINESRELVALAQLSKLELAHLPKLTHIWRRGPHIICQAFQNLTNLFVYGCHGLKSLFSLSIASGLIKLKTLRIERCSGMEEIFSKERGNEDENGVGKIGFPNLKDLLLYDLPNLVAFCNAVDEIELPELEKMELCKIPKLKTWASQRHHVSTKPSLFNKKVTFNKMATLTVYHLENLMEVWPAECEDVSTCEPRYLDVSNCDKLLNVFPYNNIIQRLQNLEDLSVHQCSSVEVIFDLQGLISVNESWVALAQLRALDLYDLPKLTHILRRGPHIICQAFQNLTNLTVFGCPRLESIFSLSTARGLVMLQVLDISNCEMMEEIFPNEGGEDEKGAVAKIEFPNLKELTLSDLPNLICFCKSVDEIEHPQLKSLSLGDLPKLAGHYPERKSLASDIFKPKVMPTVSRADTNVNNYERPMTVFTTNDIQNFENLESIEIGCNSSVEVVFDLQGLDVNEGHGIVLLPQLSSLDLYFLPKLTHIWRKGPHTIQGFQNLRRMEVRWDCDSLRYLFTASVAKILVQLEDLKVGSCNLLEGIVVADEERGEEEEEEATLFPRLGWFYLENLPRLSTIMPEPYSLNLSSMKEMTVRNCGGIKEIVKGIYDELKADGRSYIIKGDILEEGSSSGTVRENDLLEEGSSSGIVGEVLESGN